MTTSWRFPPRTTEVQFDEKWAFVAKKEAHCDRSDPADDHSILDIILLPLTFIVGK